MAGVNVKEFTDGNFEAEVLRSPEPVVVDFWAEWCQPCRMLGPTIDALATKYNGKAKIGKVDIDNNQKIAADFGIMAIPTVLVFKGGEKTAQNVGLTTRDKLVGLLGV